MTTARQSLSPCLYKISIVILLLIGACGAPLPPNAVPLANAEAAAQTLMDRWQEPKPLPNFYGVPADPACGRVFPDGSRAIGFVNPSSGHCTGGFTDPDAGVFLLLHPDVRYSHHLAHELQHWLRDDWRHELRGVWEPPLGESDTNLVPQANVWLRAHPELDVVHAVMTAAEAEMTE